MELDKKILSRGAKFIVGLWKPSYVVNFFSEDLRHIPASEFKSEKGDLSKISFAFFADNTLSVRFPDGGEQKGEWKQTDLYEYEWTFPALKGENPILQNFCKISVFEGDLTFSVSFLTVALSKSE